MRLIRSVVDNIGPLLLITVTCALAIRTMRHAESVADDAVHRVTVADTAFRLSAQTWTTGYDNVAIGTQAATPAPNPNETITVTRADDNVPLRGVTLYGADVQPNWKVVLERGGAHLNQCRFDHDGSWFFCDDATACTWAPPNKAISWTGAVDVADTICGHR
jgi:hypothetical protein